MHALLVRRTGRCAVNGTKPLLALHSYISRILRLLLSRCLQISNLTDYPSCLTSQIYVSYTLEWSYLAFFLLNLHCDVPHNQLWHAYLCISLRIVSACSLLETIPTSHFNMWLPLSPNFAYHICCLYLTENNPTRCRNLEHQLKSSTWTRIRQIDFLSKGVV